MLNTILKVFLILSKWNFYKKYITAISSFFKVCFMIILSTILPCVPVKSDAAAFKSSRAKTGCLQVGQWLSHAASPHWPS